MSTISNEFPIGEGDVVLLASSPDEPFVGLVTRIHAPMAAIIRTGGWGMVVGTVEEHADIAWPSTLFEERVVPLRSLVRADIPAPHRSHVLRDSGPEISENPS
jgi:hypothetical protein